jgi:hypothetical protein
LLQQQNEGPIMTTPSNSDSVFNASGTIPFPDLARERGERNRAERNREVQRADRHGDAEPRQGMVRIRRHEIARGRPVFRTIHDCRSVQDLQQAYAQFWQTAFTQYGEEAQRLMRLTQGTVKDAARTAQATSDVLIHTDKAA